MKIPKNILLILITITFVCSYCASAKDDKNIILITISSLRADHVSSMGYFRETTPNFDKFAASGVLFTNAFATSGWMMPTVGSIFTSQYPSSHGAVHIQKKLNDNVVTLAQSLKQNGYYTAGFSCNPRLSGEYGFSQGFDFYDDFSVKLMLESFCFDQSANVDINSSRTNNLINDAVMRWLAKNEHEKFFLYVHYYDNHWDYLPGEPYKSMFDKDYDGDIDGTAISKEPLYSNMPAGDDVEHIIALYDGQVRQTDADLGELLKLFRDKQLFENSLIVVMGDHGEQFYEHGHTSHHGIFDELVHVPMVIAGNGVNGTGRYEGLVSSIDVMPTLLDYAGLEYKYLCKGKSLAGILQGNREEVNEYVYMEYAGGAMPDCKAVRTEKFKFVNQEGSVFCYDIVNDADEGVQIKMADFNEPMKLEYAEFGELFGAN